jgi:2-succinyl-5-enolpyruvyl-6-hydroxy-3-cyclohexene-1-carboxylate synthase
MDNLLSEWAALLLSSVADAGIREIVSSPGSRSTPFVAAALREPRLRMYDVIDERAAAFFALGLARITGRPAAVLCTSGSAAAHYFPAVIEANASGVPLVILTSDRPIEVQDCGAAQTIDQTKLFGDHARKFVEVGAPESSERALRSLRQRVIQACAGSLYPVPGAVQINVRARKPLEPVLDSLSDDGRSLKSTVDRIRARTTTVALPRETADPSGLRAAADLCARSERGLIVCGPAPASFAASRAAVFDLARRTGFPLLTELPSQMRLATPGDGIVVCDGFDSLFRSSHFRRDHKPDLVIQLGSNPTSSGWELFSDLHHETPRIVLSSRGAWVDPTRCASHFIFGDIGESVASLARLLPERRAYSSWTERFADATMKYSEATDELLASSSDLTEGRTARILLERIPAGSGLFLANSLPVRTAEAFGRRRNVDLTVLCQRGANGIDGLIAGSCGAAHALGRPFTLFIGDVSFLHDLTSLMLARDLEQPFVIVVVQNQGGRIFEQLPLGYGPLIHDQPLTELYRGALSHACTPHDIEFGHAAALYGHDYARVTTDQDLRAALDAAYGRKRCTVVEVIVQPSGAAEEYKRLWRAVDAALSG